MAPLILAGFDAGQTTCRCRIRRWDPDLQQWDDLSDGQGSGVSHLEADGGEERFVAAIRSSLNAALKAVDLGAVDLGAVDLGAAAIGASGLEQDTPLQSRAQALMADALALPASQCLATGDERTALHGAFPDRAGIVLISGTGMICIGRDGSGHEARSGGWGWMLDGGGSAFDLGHQGLQLTLRMADGRLPDGPLRQRLWRALGCGSAAEIKALVVRPERSIAALAQLAPLVVEAAGSGEHGALAILQRSADALAEAAAAVAHALRLESPVISPQGGALQHLPLFHQQVEQALNQRLTSWSWHQGQADACAGALALAHELLAGAEALRPR